MAEPARHHRALFAMTADKLPEAARALALPGVANSTQDPVELMALRREQWREVWCRSAATIKPAVSAMQNLRNIALQFPLPAITVDELDDALRSYRDHTWLGLDNTGPLYFKHLPLPARQALAELLSGFDRAQARPWQVLGHALALLGKPTGGERTIALTDFLIRLWSRCRRSRISAWCSEWQGHLDRAEAGSSALRAATLRKC